MRLSKKDYLIYNHENAHFEDVVGESFTRNHDKWVGKSLKQFDILILRDPFNLLASNLRWARGTQYQPTIDSIRELLNLMSSTGTFFRIKKYTSCHIEFSEDFLEQRYLSNNAAPRKRMG